MEKGGALPEPLTLEETTDTKGWEMRYYVVGHTIEGTPTSKERSLTAS